jgi:hypothetical protein
MKIEMYPSFEDVFNDSLLKGIFYPLCKVSEIGGEFPESLFFVSSNGIWPHDEAAGEFNSRDFAIFHLESGKYSFRGSVELYQGYSAAKDLLQNLEEDFQSHGVNYLTKKLSADTYIEKMLKTFPISDTEMDREYFIRTFYEYHINKLNYMRTGKVGSFYHVMEGWAKPDTTPIVYDMLKSESSGYGDIEVNQEYLFPKSLRIDGFEKVGFVMGSEFFTEGNDSYLFFDKENQMVLCVNHYS